MDQNVLKDQLSASINILKKYKGVKSKKDGLIATRLLPFETGFGLFIIDGNTLEGVIKMELQLKKSDPSAWPNLIITRKDPQRYNQLIEQFNALWELSDPI